MPHASIESLRAQSWYASSFAAHYVFHEMTDNDSAALLQAVWRAARTRLPPLITGAGGNDGDSDPAAALFNMVFIRVPFLLACAALVANVLLGGGVVIGSFVWPLVGYDDCTGLSI